MLVLPRLVEKDARTIYFPDLQYPQKFWEKLSKFKADEYVFHFNAELNEMADKLLPNFDRAQINTANIEGAWKKYEAEFFACLEEFLPKYAQIKARSITCLVTPFGSVGSLYFIKNKSAFDFEITIRKDFGPAQIAETILTQLFHIDQTNMSIPVWTNREAIIDFLLMKTKFGQLFNYEYSPTVSTLPEISDNLVSESNTYLTKLGFPLSPTLATHHELITINNTPVYNHFTATEKNILVDLIAHKNQLISYDQIGNDFWGEDSLDKFSLYSIAKIMEKIRKKIKDAGVYQELIYTVRGKGYVLYD